MWELIKAGGWLMWPLMLCSVLMVAIIIERSIRLKRTTVFPKHLVGHARHNTHELVEQFNVENAEKSTLGRVLSHGYQAQTYGPDYARAQMEAAASHEIEHLEKNVNFLGTISAVAPLLGLLGTVVGIIEAFLVIDGSQLGDASSMIPGISKALITTAVGMLIAIPALVAYRYYQRLIIEYVNELERQATLFHATIFHKNIQD